jgi:hypothetical protein
MEPLRLTQLFALDGLRHNHEGVMEAALQILGAQLSAQIKSHTARKDPIQFF